VYRVYLKIHDDNIKINLPDIYTDDDSETTSDQIKTYICQENTIDFHDLHLDIKRNGTLKRKCCDLEIEDEDELFFYSKKSKTIDIRNINMKAGFHSISHKKILEYDPKLIDKIITTTNELYLQRITMIQNKINSENIESVKETVDNFFVNKYNDTFVNEYPFNMYNKNMYFCKFQNGKPYGFGFMYDEKNENYYEGNFNGSYIIQGRSLHLKEKDDKFLCICQEFSDFKPHGFGYIIYLNETEKYEGMLMYGMYYGRGKLDYKGDSYHGNFIESNKSGYGTMKYKNGDKYYGYWSKNMKNMFGTYIYENSNYFSGIYLNDVQDEYGVFYDKENNISYIGTFKDGIRTFNKDEFILSNKKISNDQFIGQYNVKLTKDDNLYNKLTDIKIYENEDVYVSQSSNDKSINKKDKSRTYIGNFDYDTNIHGCGRLFYDDNNMVINNFSDREPYSEEYIKEKYQNYIEYQCVFSERNSNGFGVIKYSNGDKYIGNIKNGFRNGNGTLFKTCGQIDRVYWVNNTIGHTTYI